MFIPALSYPSHLLSFISLHPPFAPSSSFLYLTNIITFACPFISPFLCHFCAFFAQQNPYRHFELFYYSQSYSWVLPGCSSCDWGHYSCAHPLSTHHCVLGQWQASSSWTLSSCLGNVRHVVVQVEINSNSKISCCAHSKHVGSGAPLASSSFFPSSFFC